jgi:hypothetical protein
MKEFKVHETEIPKQITVNLGMYERALFARILTRCGINVDNAGDTFEFIFKKGLRKYYEERYGEE